MRCRSFRRIRRGLAKAGPLLLLASLLPGLSAIDHWGPGRAGGEGSAAEDAHSETHVSHCHYNPGSCSDQPLPPNPNAFPGLIQLPSPAFSLQRLYEQALSYDEVLPMPPDQPPRSA